MEPYATVDTSRTPVVLVRVTGTPCDENYRAHLAELEAAYLLLDKFALIFDTGQLPRFPARYREMLTRWIDDTRPAFESRWVSAAFVIRSPMVRGALTAVFWLSPPYYAYYVTGREEDAWSWTRKMLEEAGVAAQLGDTP